MIGTSRLLKVTVAWISIVYVVCFLGVAVVPGIRKWFIQYALHATNVGIEENVTTLGTFVSGFITWNIVAVLVVLLFASLWNRIKK